MYLSDVDKNLISALIGGIFSVIILFIGAIMNHFLEEKRIKRKSILDKKIEIYSDILTKLNTVFQDEGDNIFTNPLFKKTISTRLAKALSRGRLIANKKLEYKLREYYGVAVKWWRYEKNENENEKDAIGDKMSGLVIEIEQLMRDELGSGRVLSRCDIKKHCQYNLRD